MGLYRRYILPPLCHFAMRNHEFRPYRERVVGAATGRVLEIGVGSGLNLAYYPGAVGEVFALEPEPRLLRMARGAKHASGIPIHFLEGSAETIPLDRASIDTAVTTWTLCTIPDALEALKEVRRVLRPGGHLLFVEHGLAPEERVRWWQDHVTPLWCRLAGGCHLNRPIQTMIEDAGFRIARLETGYMRGPKFLTFLYQGNATPL